MNIKKQFKLHKHLNKMKSLIKTLLVSIPLIFSSASYAQKVWTLEDCIGYALQNNLQIKRQELQTEISANNHFQSKMDLLPNLGIYGNHSITSGFAVNTNVFQTSNNLSEGNFGIQSNMILFSGLQKLNTIKMYKYNFLTTKENLKRAQNDIIVNIASAYLGVLLSKELLDVSKNQLDVTLLQVERTEKLVDVGNLAKGSLYEIQAQAASEEASYVDSKNKLDLSYITLTQLLDLDTLKSFEILVPKDLVLPLTFAENPDSIFQVAVNNLPEIKSAEFGLKSAESSLSIAKGSRYPQLSMSAGLGSTYILNNKHPDLTPYPISSQIHDYASQNISFSLNIPIFSKFLVQKNVSNAKINVIDANYSLKQSKITLRKEVEQAYADAIAAFQNYKARQKSVEAYEENFKYVQEKFDVGLVNSLDYNIAKNNFIKAKSDLLQTKYDFLFKTEVLEFYKGNPIKL
jgi:outer membrane protein